MSVVETTETTDENTALKVFALSGTLHSPSKTGTLIGAILESLRQRTVVDAVAVDVLPLGHALVEALSGSASGELATAIGDIGDADVIVIATPVYKGSYTGLLKLFVDLLGQDALRGRPVILAAAGGSDHHSLVIEHELRPLLGFFGAHTVPTGIYARGADFADGGISDGLQQTIDRAATEAIAIARRR